MKIWILKKNYHAGHHDAQGPDIEGVVVIFVGNEEFWAFEIPRTDSDVIVFFGEVELSEAPVDDAQLNQSIITFLFS